MRILIDTNIVIYREQNKIISRELQELSRIIEETNNQKLVHPLSIKELEKDADKKRKNIHLSKIGSYLVLEKPPTLSEDKEFLSKIGLESIPRGHDFIDMSLLYCVYRDAVHFLITEDKQILKNAEKLGLSERVFSIEEALEYLKKVFLAPKRVPISPPALREEFLYNLDLGDPFFDSLKEEYGKKKFKQWWKKICQEGRKGWVYFVNGNIGALLIYKTENVDELTKCSPPLPQKKMMKICTLKVTHMGFKIGELFIKLAVNYAIKNNLNEIYLTHFTKEDDLLVSLIEEYGFERYSQRIYKKNGKEKYEDVYFKKLMPDIECQSPLELQRKFYPSLYDGEKVNKYVIPIQPVYHNRLFTGYKRRQPTLFEFGGGLITEGNTIKKAYLCHAKAKQISSGDIVLFYRSHDDKSITSIGVVEKTYYDITDPDEIERIVGKRTVYNRKEIEKISEKPTTILLFKLHFHFPHSLNLYDLQKEEILSSAPRSIQKIKNDETYCKLIEKSGIDEKYFVN